MCQLTGILRKANRVTLLLLGLVLIVTALGQTALAQGFPGVYAGGHETSAGMGGTVSYYYYIDFKDATNYVIRSYFIMGDDLYDFEEKGTYIVSDKTLTITPEGGEAVQGSINSDGTISTSLRPSMMASQRREVTLAPAPNPVAGVYTTTFTVPYQIDVTLFLTHQGEYFYMAVPGNDAEALHESGTYNLMGNEITFVITSSGETFKGTFTDGEISAPFAISAVMGMRMEIDLAR